MSGSVDVSRLRLFLIFFVSLSLVFSLLGWGLALQQKKMFVTGIKLKEASSSNFQQRLFLSTLDNYLSDALILADSIRNEYTHMHPVRDTERRVSDYFQSFARSRPHYDQIRLINPDGMERIRVNWNETSGAVVVPRSQLQNKKKRFYFERAMTMDAAVYVSAFDLNVENNAVEKPFKPMIRISCVVKDGEQHTIGLLVLNLLGKTLLNQLKCIGQGVVGDLYFINDKGQWLIGPTPEDGWQFMFPEKKQTTLGDLFPDVWPEIESLEKGQFFSTAGLFSFAKVDPGVVSVRKHSMGITVQAEETWTIVSRVTKKDLLPVWWRMVQIFLMTGVVMIAILAWYMADIQMRRYRSMVALKENEKKLISITDTVQDAIALVDSKGLVHFWNRAAEKMFALSAGEIMGKDIHRFVTPDHLRADAAQGLGLFSHSGKGRFIGNVREVEAQRKDGGRFPVELHLSAVQMEGQWFAVGVARDITQRLKARQELLENEAKFRAIFNQMFQFIGLIAPDGTVMELNETILDFAGISAVELQGKKFWDAPWWDLSKETVDRLKKAIARAARGEFVRYEVDVVGGKGQIITIDFSIKPVKGANDEIVLLIPEGRDISEKIVFEKALAARESQVKALNEQLEARVKQRTRELEAAVETIGRRERMTRLLQDVASISNTATSVEQALETTLTLVAEYINWPVGHVYMPDSNEPVLLIPTPLWHLDDPEDHLEFIDVTMNTTFQVGEGLPGRVFSSCSVHWITDVKEDDNFPRAGLLKKSPVRGAFGFPVTTQQGVVAVLEFFTTEIYPMDNDIMTMAEEVGRQLSYVVERKRVEAEMEKLALVVERTANGVMITDKNGCVEWVNQGFTKISGYSLKELAGRKPGHILQGPDTDPNTVKRIGEALSREAGIHVELINYHKSGYRYWLELDIEPIFDDAGRLINFISIENDISERRATNAALEQFKATLDQTFDAVFIFDSRTLYFTYVNHGATNQVGYSREEMLNMTPVDIKPEFTKTDFIELVAPLRKKEIATLSFETVHQHKDGRHIPVDILLQLLDRPGGSSEFVAIVRDITEQKRILRELEHSRDEARQAARVKAQFLANMSHEIRTPMNAILGMAHLLSNTDTSPSQRNFIQKIQAAGNNLLGIINDILDFSKIEAGQMKIEQVAFELDGILTGISDMVAVKAQEKGLELLFHAQKGLPRHLVGDPLRIGQVLINLANNAVKFTPKGEVVISVSGGDIENDRIPLHFVVRDTGIGMSSSQIQTLFQPFSQADASTTRKFGGTGLGLAICRQLALLMEGDIWAESEEGKGSAFHFKLTLICPPNEERQPFIPAPDLRGMRVLVLDDNATFQEIIKEMLEDFTFHVTLASSGSEAISQLERAVDEGNPIDLVLADWKMPGMDGIETSRNIKDNPRISHTPTIIMITAFGREEIMERADRSGLDGFLIKPVNRSLLFNTIMECFGKSVDRGETSHPFLGTDAATLQMLKGLHVLLVEDNLFNQDVARELLETVGVDVTVVDNGLKAVEAVANTAFDAVLMDIQMPEMDGYEAMRIIRSRESNEAHLPLIAMTANVMAADRDQVKSAGADDQVDKPITPSLLYAALAKWTRRDGKEETVQPLENSYLTNAQTDLHLPLLPDLDAVRGLKRFEGNRDLFTRLLHRFKSEQKEMVPQIQRAIAAQDHSLAGRLLHTLKGLAATIGARGLAQKAEAMEHWLFTGEKYPSEKEMHDLGVTMEKVLTAIDKVVTELEPATKREDLSYAPLDKETLYRQLTELAAFLKADDYEAHVSVKKLVQGTVNTPLEADVQRMKTEIEGYDYTAAIDGVEKVLKKLNSLN